jgi:hypothetical protein
VPLEEQPVSARLARIRAAVETLLNAKRVGFMEIPLLVNNLKSNADVSSQPKRLQSEKSTVYQRDL